MFAQSHKRLILIAAAVLSLPSLAQAENKFRDTNPPFPTNLVATMAEPRLPPRIHTGARVNLDKQGKANIINFETARIIDIQKKLKSKGYKIEVTGAWGAVSDNALKSYQRQHNIVASGLLDQKTKQTLGVN